MVSGSTAVRWTGAFVVCVVAFGAIPRSQTQAPPSGPNAASQPSAASLDPKAEAVLIRVCGQCHDWQRVSETRRTRDDWGRVIDDMVTRGAAGTDADYDAVLDYVLRHDALVNVNRATAEDLATILNLTDQEAEAIVSYRTANGKFANLEALKAVKDVDPKKLESARAAMFF
jgi:competence protein ComEA